MPLVLLFVFSCGLSIGILVGRRDERRKSGQRSVTAVVAPVAPATVVSPVEQAAAAPMVTAPAPAEATPAEATPPAAAAEIPGPVGPAGPAPELAALPDPPPPPIALPNSKAKRAGLTEDDFRVRDDILDRMRTWAESGGLDPALDAPTRAEVASALSDHRLAETERRVLERLRQQQRQEDADDASSEP